MKYIHLETISEGEKRHRERYLRDTFNLFFIEVKRNKYVEFVSLPSDANNCMLIYGHNKDVNSFLKQNIVNEKIIMLVTCNVNLSIPSKYKSKKIYISKSSNNVTNYYDGEKYGFHFDVTDSELLLFRYRKSSFEEQINKSFEKVKL